MSNTPIHDLLTRARRVIDGAPSPKEHAPVTHAAPAQPQPPYIRHSSAPSASYPARVVGAAYGFPLDRYNGAGTTIGIIELGGAYDSADMRALTLDPSRVTCISVDGGRQQSDGPDGADGEVMLDVEIAAAIAPAAAIRVYFAANDSDTGFLDAVKQASAECDVVSISWGGPENSWDPSSIKRFSAAFADARKRGVPVFAAAGDAGSRDGTSSNVVDYPASDPSVIGCGGTRLTLDAAGHRAAEIVWDDDPTQSATGGGVSRVFPGRSVPDVAGNADPVSGYQVIVDGQRAVVGGTSAVAPLLAAGYALLRQAHGGAFDFLNLCLTNPSALFDVTVGNNGGYKAGPGRDSVSGLGVPDFGRLLTILMSGAQVPAPGGGVTTGGTGSTGGGSTPTPAPTPAPAPTAGGATAGQLDLVHELEADFLAWVDKLKRLFA